MRTSAASAVLILLVVSSAAQALADQTEMEKASVQAVRSAGVSIMTALGEQLPSDTAAQVRPANFDWTSCPAVSFDRLVAILGPQHASEIPQQDGWGNALEFCLKVDKNAPPGSRFVAGIRSPGRDRHFDQSSYGYGPFAFEEADRDVVWLNGFFFSWPQK
jgi:hypothetical protein